MISTYHSAEAQTMTKRGKAKEVCVRDSLKQNMGGIDKKDQLLQVYLVKRKGMNKWYMKLFRSLLKATFLNFPQHIQENIRWKVDDLKFWIDLIEELLVKYSMQHEVPGYHGDDNTVNRLTEQNFPRRIPTVAWINLCD
jgi:hypothetical protein